MKKREKIESAALRSADWDSYIFVIKSQFPVYAKVYIFHRTIGLVNFYIYQTTPSLTRLECFDIDKNLNFSPDNRSCGLNFLTSPTEILPAKTDGLVTFAFFEFRVKKSILSQKSQFCVTKFNFVSQN